MFGKKLLWSLLALCLMMNAGCCRMWERWCDRPHYQPQPYCCPQPCCPTPPSCPPPSFSSPAGAVPVPPAPGGTNWARPCP
jgi:hypothetical protein